MWDRKASVSTRRAIRSHESATGKVHRVRKDGTALLTRDKLLACHRRPRLLVGLGPGMTDEPMSYLISQQQSRKRWEERRER
jgi:hypothetical protein